MFTRDATENDNDMKFVPEKDTYFKSPPTSNKAPCHHEGDLPRK